MVVPRAAAAYGRQLKMSILGHAKTQGIHAASTAKPSYVKYIIRQGEAKLRILELTSVFHHLPSQAIVCVSTPKMHPQSGSFLVHFELIF